MLMLLTLLLLFLLLMFLLLTLICEFDPFGKNPRDS